MCYRQRATFRVVLPNAVQGQEQIPVSRTTKVVQERPPVSIVTETPQERVPVSTTTEVVQERVPVSTTAEVMQPLGVPRVSDVVQVPPIPAGYEHVQGAEVPRPLENPQSSQDSQARIVPNGAPSVPKAPMRPSATPIRENLPVPRPQQ